MSKPDEKRAMLLSLWEQHKDYESYRMDEVRISGWAAVG